MSRGACPAGPFEAQVPLTCARAWEGMVATALERTVPIGARPE